MYFLVETGLLGEPGCFVCTAAHLIVRDAEVVCRTERGIERGVVRAVLGSGTDGLPVAGSILRLLGENDRLIAERLERFRLKAVAACEQLLVQEGINAVLVDAEQLLDGEHLVFHFLGDVDAARDAVLDQLAETWDRKVGFRRFAERLAEGCGPGCGSTAGGCGAGSGGCAGCGSAGGCGLRTESKTGRSRQ